MKLSVTQLLTKAKSFTHKGDIKTAAQIYHAILQQFPNNKQATDGLKELQPNQSITAHSNDQPPQNQINALIAMLQHGQLDKVIEHARPMTHKYPNSIALYDFLGIAHMGLRNYDQSIACYQRALQLKPDFAEGYNNLGAALRAYDRIDAAITNYHKAIQLKPDYAEAHNNLGIIQQEIGKIDAAISSLKTALECNPDFPDAHFNLGSALKKKGFLAEAITHFEKGLLIKPDNSEALNNLGNTQQEHGLLDEAIANYKKSLSIHPNITETHLNLASALKIQGHLDTALVHYKKALELNPEYILAYRNYATAMTFSNEDAITTKMAALLDTTTITDNDRMHLSFALGKVKLDISQPEIAIDLLKAGNAIRKKELGYDISTDISLFEDIKTTFDTISIPPILESFTDKPTPIFILGMPRSGTTLVEQIVSSHTDVYGAGELSFMDDILNHIDWRGKAFDNMVLSEIRAEFYNSLSGKNASKRFITDKMPANFRWVGFIAQAFPEAKIIHVNRNPAAVCWSNFKLYFPANGMRYSFDMEDIAHYYGLYQNLMEFWHDRFPNRIYDLNYESLTENQLEESQKLLTFLGLDWQDAVMEFHKNTRNIATASNIQVRSKMYTGSSQEWEKYQNHLGPMLKILNELPRS